MTDPSEPNDSASNDASPDDETAPESEPKKRRVRLLRRTPPPPEDPTPKKRRVRLVRKPSPTPEETADPSPPHSRDERPLEDVDDPLFFDASFEDEIDPQNPADSVTHIISKIAETLLPKILKKAVSSGTGILSEENIRSVLRDTPMPKEVTSLLSGQVESVREEFYNILAREVRRFLDSLDLAGELQRILTSLSFEIRTEVRFIPNDQAVAKPKISNRVRVRRNRDEEKDE